MSMPRPAPRLPRATTLCLALALALPACARKAPDAPPKPAKPRPAKATPAKAAPAKTTAAPTAADALAFLEETERALLDLWIHRERTEWVKATHITHDTEILAARAEEQVMAFVAKAASRATEFKGVKLPADAARKLKLLRTAQTLPSPPDPSDRKALAKLATEMGAEYGKRKVVVKAGDGSKIPQGTYTLGKLSTLLQTSPDPEVQKEAWQRWRAAGGVEAGERYTRFVALANKGAKSMGFSDLGELWRSGYDMPPDAFAAEVDRLWSQVAPLYKDLHCYARTQLRKKYGDAVPAKGPLPAWLMGNMWAQDWLYRMDLLRPEPSAGKTRTLTDVLVEKKTSPEQMMRYGEAFFVSLGLDKLPDTFWQRSMLARPKDREVVCHASAWDVDWQDDLRVKMCVEINEEDFVTVHHELGHNYYQRAYKSQPTLFTNSANDGFHEALGDTIALSVTPAYLKQIGLDPAAADPKAKRSELNFLMQRAVEKVAFLPFGLLVDKFRWQVFAGEVKPADYNAAWWKLRLQYQGVAPPGDRSKVATFDAGGKYHVAASVPYMRYFLAHILQFQLHRALCKVAGHTGPLHTCSIYGNKEAGARLNAMMKMGLSRPWPEALKAATGETRMDASAVLAYFAPLHTWLKAQNKGQTCGW